MNWIWRDMPPVWQWVGLMVTVLGTVFAVTAALAARGAKLQAAAAREAATRLGHLIQITDLLSDLQELQTILARGDLIAISAKANTVRGRVVRFKGEAYNRSKEDAIDLDRAREQLESIARAAVSPRIIDTTRMQRMHISLGTAAEVLSRVHARYHVRLRSEE